MFVNYDEFVADTRPFDGASYLAVDTASPAPGGPAFTFESSTQRIYQVDAATDPLLADWMPLTGSFMGEGTSTVSDTSGAPSRTYRIRVRTPYGLCPDSNPERTRSSFQLCGQQP